MVGSGVNLSRKDFLEVKKNHESTLTSGDYNVPAAFLATFSEAV